MAWWEKLFEPMPTGNLVGDTLSAINGSPAVSAARSEAGSFDPNKIKMAMPESYREGVAPYVETLTGLANQRQAAIEQAYKMPDSTWMQGLGRALSAISVPVGYAQGSSYGPAMLGRTEQDIYNRRSDVYQDRLNAARAQGVDSLYSGLGQSAVDYISKTNERTREARLQAARIIQAARQTGDPNAIARAEAMARQILEVNGVSERTGSSAVPKSAIGAPAAAVGSASTGAVPTGVPGTVMTPPTGAPPAGAGTDVEIGVPSVVAPVAPAAGSPEARAAALRADAMWMDEAGLKKQAEENRKEAERLEEPGQKGKVKYAEKAAEASVERQTKEILSEENAGKAGEYLDILAGYSKVPGVDYYIGPIQGSSFAPYTSDLAAAIVPGNEANPGLRDQIKGTQMALVALLKGNIRVPGEGSQDQREFQAVIDTVGDMSNARNVAQLREKLVDAKKRIEVLIGRKINTRDDIYKTDARTSVAGAAKDEQPVPPASLTVGRTATNQKTGEKMMWDGEKWVRMSASPTPDGIAP